LQFWQTERKVCLHLKTKHFYLNKMRVRIKMAPKMVSQPLVKTNTYRKEEFELTLTKLSKTILKEKFLLKKINDEHRRIWSTDVPDWQRESGLIGLGF